MHRSRQEIKGIYRKRLSMSTLGYWSRCEVVGCIGPRSALVLRAMASASGQRSKLGPSAAGLACATPRNLLTSNPSTSIRAIAARQPVCITQIHSFQSATIALLRIIPRRTPRLAAAPRGQTPHRHRQHVARKPCARVLTHAKCVQSSPRPDIDSRLEDARQPSPRSPARRFPLLRNPRRRITTEAIPSAIAARPGAA